MENTNGLDSKTPALNLDDRFFTRLLRIILLLLGVFFAIKLIPLLSGAIATIVAAILFAAVLQPVVDWMENNGINRVGAIMMVFIAIIVLVGLLVYISSPIITAQLDALSSSLKNETPAQLIDTLLVKLGETIPFLKNPQVSAKIAEKLQFFMVSITEKVFSAAIGLISSFTNVIIIAFAVFFFLKDGWKIKRAIIEAMPNRYFEMSLILVHKTTEQLSNYIRGQLIVAAAVGTLSIIALTLLDIRYSFLIGALAGLANTIPYFGPIVGAIPAIAIGLIDTGNFGVVLAIAGSFATIQLTENIFISPIVVAKSVELHPLAIIIVILIGGALLGLWGMLLAVPVTAIIKVTFAEIRWGFENYHIGRR